MQQVLDVLSGKGGIVFGSLAVLFLLERLFPARQWIGGHWRVAKNFLLAACNFVMGPLIVLPITFYAASHALDWRPEVGSGLPGLLLDLLVLDCWIYWWHRVNHVVPFLWRFHEVHHLDEMLDTSSALRFHFGEVALSALVRAGVIFLLAMPLASVVAFEIVIALSALFHHSNLNLPARFERLLSRVIVTPSIHWVHHHAVRGDTDSNYSTVLSVWDRVFGSRSLTARSVDMRIGVEGRNDLTALHLLAKPFKSSE